MMRVVKPRIIIEIEGGLIASISAEGISNFAEIDVIKIDYDTDGEVEDTVKICGRRAWFSVDGITKTCDKLAQAVERQYNKWVNE